MPRPPKPDTPLLADAGHDLAPDLEPGPITSSLAWATWALFAGLGLMLAGAGLFATLVGVRSELAGFSTVTIGVISATYYLGFLVGSRVTLQLLGTVGHIRVYAALAAVLSATVIGAGLLVHPVAWALLRLLAGMCLAGQYVVAESWLNQIVSHEGRGRLLIAYNVTTVVAFGVGQIAITGVDPRAIVGFGIAAMLVSIAVVPVSLSEEAAPPILAKPSKLSLRELWNIAATGVVTSMLVGVAHGSFVGLAAVYATRAGLSTLGIGLFVIAPTIGSLVFSVPIAAASDGYDRRLVGTIVAIVAALGGVGLATSGPDHWLGLLSAAVIGGMTYPLYAIAGAYTNDWIPAEQLISAASHMVLVYGAGAFIGPLAGSVAMAFHEHGYAWTTVIVHTAIAMFLLVRMLQHPAATRARPWNEIPMAGRVLYLPATALAMGRRLRPYRRAHRPASRADA